MFVLNTIFYLDQSKISPTSLKIKETEVLEIVCISTELAIWHFNSGPLPLNLIEFFAPHHSTLRTSFAKSVNSGIYECIGIGDDGKTFIAVSEIKVLGK